MKKLQQKIKTQQREQQNKSITAESLVRDNLLAKTTLGNIELLFSFKKESYTGIEKGNEISLLRTARQLGRIEPLICLLEDWLNVPLDFTPVRQDLSRGERVKINISMHMDDIDNDIVKAILYLPLTSIHQLNPPDSALKSLMQWSSMPCSIRVENTEIDYDQLRLLEVGGMMLLPASFETFWRCCVYLHTDKPPVFSAELDANHQRLIFDVFDSPGYTLTSLNNKSDDLEMIEVHLFRSMTMPLDLLLGWTEHPVFIFEQTLASFTVVLINEGERVAYGSLVPIGDGYGVLIKNVVGEL